MKYQNLMLSLCVGLFLVGCDSRIDAVNMQMAEIRSSLAAELKIMAGKRVYPNLSRQLQPLESYAIESLNMKGSMRGQNGQILALIQTPDGEIERVQRGSYLGMNHGRVINITATQIDLVEIIPDGREGYVERPRSLVLIGPAP